MYDIVEYINILQLQENMFTQRVYIKYNDMILSTIYIYLYIYHYRMRYDNGTLYYTCLQDLNVPFVYVHLRRDARCGDRWQRFGYEGVGSKMRRSRKVVMEEDFAKYI